MTTWAEYNKIKNKEMQKLIDALVAMDIPFERYLHEDAWGHKCYGWNQVVSPNKEEWAWDVICHRGSYGYEQGLLEIGYKNCDEVEGWLTAEQVLERIEK